jgi:single-strand DNA-binding protein
MLGQLFINAIKTRPKQCLTQAKLLRISTATKSVKHFSSSATLFNNKPTNPDFCVNKVTLIGYVGQDAVTRKSATGGQVTFFSMATSENVSDSKGNRKMHTDWHRVVVYGEKLGSVVEKLATKGSRVYVDGSVRTRRYTDAVGNERSQTEVVIQPYAGEFLALQKNDMMIQQFDDDMGSA